MGLSEQSALARNGDFRDKVRAAIVNAALQVQGEGVTVTPTVDQKRANLAASILQDGGSNRLDAFSYACAAYNNGAVSLLSADADLPFVVSTIFNDLAGITGADAIPVV